MEKLTKTQVIELVKNADGVLICTNAGETVVSGWDNCIEFASTLEAMHFEGALSFEETPCDITSSPNYEPEWSTYKFSGNNPDADIYVNIGE